MTYFLPRQLVRVTATRTGGGLSDAADAVIKARSELDAAKAKVASSTAAIRETEESIIAGSGGDAGKAILVARLATQKGELEANGKAVLEKETALTAAKTALTLLAGKPVTASTGPGAYKIALKIELLPPSADPSQAYRLSPRHTIFRDDEHKITISQAGLLTSSNITATDRTADMLVEVSAFAGAIRGNAFAGGGVGKSDRDQVETKNCDTSPSLYAGVVDFVDPASVLRLNGDLQCLGVKLIPEGRYWPGSSRPSASQTANVYGAIEGIVYRSPIELQVRIEKCLNAGGACTEGSSDWHAAEVVALSLPQAGPISFLRQDSGLLTKTKYDLIFKDGIPVDYAGSRPSEILEVARLPMRLVNGVFDGFSKIVSLRTGQNNDKAALVASQMALLNSQNALQLAALQGKTSLTGADLALLQSQYALQIGAIRGSADLSAAELALLQQQYALAVGSRTGATNLINADLAQLQAQSGLGVAQNTATAQLSASDLALTISLLRDHARRDSLNRCVAEKLQANLPVDACLTGL